MEDRRSAQGKSYEERIELAGRLTREFVNTELFKVLVERERQISNDPGPAQRKAPKWLHDLVDIIWDLLTD